MFSQESIKGMIDFLTQDMAVYLLPGMLITFVAAVCLRLLVQYTVRRELWFATQFSKRVHNFLDAKDDDKLEDNSFFLSMKLILELTYYEIFMVRAIKQRRNWDYIDDIRDRIFLIQEGCARLVKETLRQVRHLKYQKERPRFIELTKNVFENNVCFKKVAGILPVQVTHDVLNLLPGIFIIGGIFGTFLGIMAALPELGNMKLEDVEGAKIIMDNFLKSIAFSMSTSIIGIIVSVAMTFVNTLLDPEKLFIKTVNKFENSMELLWDCCDNNVLPKDLPEFDKHIDPLDGRKIAQEDIERRILSKRTGAAVSELVGLAKKSISKKKSNVNTTSLSEVVISDDVDSKEIHNDEHDEKSNAS